MGTLKDIFTAVVGIAAPTRIVCRAVLTEELKKFGVALPPQCADEVYAVLEYHQNIATKKKELELAMKGADESFKSLTNKSELAVRCERAAHGIASYLVHGVSTYVDGAGLRDILDRHIGRESISKKQKSIIHADKVTIILILKDVLLDYTEPKGDSYSFTNEEFSLCREYVDKAMNQSGVYSKHFNNPHHLFLLSFSAIAHVYRLASRGPYKEALASADYGLRMEYEFAKAKLQQQVHMNLAYCVNLFYPRIRDGDVAIVTCENGAVGVGIKRKDEEAPEATFVAKTVEAMEVLEQIYADDPSLRT